MTKRMELLPISKRLHGLIPRAIGDSNKLLAGYILFVLLLSSAALANPDESGSKSLQAVFEKGGNIFLKVEDNVIQLTKTGRDHAPLMSPDGKWVAFTREIESKVKECSVKDEWICATERLWSIDLATRTERMIVEPLEDDPDMRKVIGGFRNTTFSPDGKTLYFETPVWITSGAIHAVEPGGKNERFVTDGDGLKIVKRSEDGKWVGHLVVRKHKYYLGGGAYDWYWLVAPEGKEIGPLGDDTEDYVQYFTESFKFEYMEHGSH
ncbi:MAG: PD40 domain-containing protein [Nitrospinae bacterium]|nr:PD40 domain-containing protein [Nitrospinota bacterium]